MKKKYPYIKFYPYLRDHVRDDFELVDELNIAPIGTLPYKAAVMALFANETGFKRKDAFVHWLGFSDAEVRTIYLNWQSNNLLQDGVPVIDMESFETEQEEISSFVMGLTLTALVGAGVLRAEQVQEVKQLPKAIEGFVLPPLLIYTQLLLPSSDKDRREA